MSDPIKGWAVKRSGKLVAWTCFTPGPEYSLAAYLNTSIENARLRLTELAANPDFEFVEVEIRETGRVYSDLGIPPTTAEGEGT